MKFRTIIISILFLAFIAGVNNSYSQLTREVNETFSLSNNGKVFIDTYKGSIKINTWDKPEVEVHVKIEADKSIGGTDPEEQLEDVNIKFTAKDESLYIESDYKKNKSWFGSQTLALVHYEINMPRTAKLFVEDYKSVSKINDLQADVEFETYKGDAKIRNVKGAVDIETYKGTIDLEISNLTGRSTFETYKGDITVHLPANTSFSINADVGKKGDFESDFDFMSESSRKKGRIIKADINGGGHLLEFETYKGEFAVRKR